ncbi:MAG: ribose transport system ATP-binding protein [Tepidanaerobacteraceae bacterium]|jgi:ribose transport system ATP-binding protein|nr:ribose transport system ATP-binding protein [Tepidanaerobacteraceae bacterium]MDK2879107.1 ribose transport system ATP-binding protein [Thermoanaerobacteraceae bacterium]
MQTEKPLMTVRGIDKQFPGTKALQEVSLDIFQREIHAICGENGAGKSTLMNILSGSLMPDKGKIYLNGEKIHINNPKDAQKYGISIVHQELSLCPHLNVAENIFIGRLPRLSGDRVDFKTMEKETKAILDRFHTHIKPRTLVKDLSVSQQQIVEIAKAITLNCKILILDEPTSALTESESWNLFKILEELKNNGIAILYISHRIKEIFQISQRITVLRDGRHVTTRLTSEVTPDDVVSYMVGRELDNIYPYKGNPSEKVILKVNNLTRKGVYSKISFELYRGEILGIFGLMGAGRTEMARGLCGIDPVDDGNVTMFGKTIPLNNIRSSIDSGLVYVPEDRKLLGLFLPMNLCENLVAANLKAVSRFGLVDRKSQSVYTREMLEKLNVKYRNLYQSVSSLSGGNQQKVLLAKWLAVKPKVLILDEPTRGIDVGAKSEIHHILRRMANDGYGVVVISSELPEILGICNRILVMHEGKLVAQLTSENATEENIMRYASGRAS